ncbi:MAG: hypothetical protein KIT45_03905 [Fimbriimonadia bacterium]|nr:hypothetical protein [Fimbriimonadia bacterium]
MSSIPQLSQCLQGVLGPTAQQIARETQCVQRQRKLDGATLVQTLVFQMDGTSNRIAR